MASEAQRLIGISLTKIAQSRAHRGGVSLHKNLLVATVLQKARYIFMEEAYNMVHFQPPAPAQARPVPDEELVALTAEEATALPDDIPESSSSGNYQDFLQPTTTNCVKCAENQNKENHPPYANNNNSELTYIDLDKTSNNSILREQRSNASCLKRRRAVAEWETEEAVQSILPKRNKIEAEDEDEEEDSVFLDNKEATTAATTTTTVDEVVSNNNNNNERGTMEIDRITSLVSIFSFSMGDSNNNNNNNSKLNRSVSTPDLCSAQAKDVGDSLQQRPFLAMTV